jgi:pimeloyl-ACP methyl ester carboxylesterase
MARMRAGKRLTFSFAGLRYFSQVFEHPSARTPVLLVSGGLRSMRPERAFARQLASHTTVIVCHLPGTGRADALPACHGLDFLAFAMANVLDRLEIPRVHVVAASYGGPVAYRFAQRFPGSVERLVLAGVIKEASQHARLALLSTLTALGDERMADFAREVADGVLCPDAGKPIERRDDVRRQLVRQLTRIGPAGRVRYACNTRRLLDHAALDLDAAPDVPTLVFTGEHDTCTPPDACREVADAFDQSVFTTIRRADHLFHLERFDATLSLLKWFLTGARLRNPEYYTPFEVCTRRTTTYELASA